MGGRIGMYPYPASSRWETHGNPHLRKLVDAIELAGYTVVPLTVDELLNPKRLRSKGLDALHLHWPGAMVDHFVYWELNWAKRVGWLGETLNSWLKRVVCRVVRGGGATVLRACATRRIRRWSRRLEKVDIPLVWQAHDLGSHHYVGDAYAEPLDDMVHERIFNISKALVIHEDSCLPPIEQKFGRCDYTSVARLGSYCEVYGRPMVVSAARDKLGIPAGAKVFAYIGTARANRNPERVAKAFEKIENEDAWLVVAGMGVGQYVRNAKRRVLVFDGYVEPETIRDIMCSADFVINDGQRYLTSAVVRTAISYGVPVIARRYGTAIDMADGAAIWISETADGVACALERALALGRDEWEALHRAAILRDEERRWPDAAEVCDELYKSIFPSDAGEI